MQKLSKIIYQSSELRQHCMLLHLTISMLDDKQFGINAKRLKVLEELRKKITILKSDKGQDIALLKHNDYTNCCKLIEVS